MREKINKFLLVEKIPAIVCMLACTASILMGFAIGYVFFGPGEYLAYADTSDPYQAEVPCVASFYVETPIPPTPTPVPYNDEPHQEDAVAYMYRVSVSDGYIVVYHQDGNGGWYKEVTSTTVGALAPEELEQLAKGIHIYSEEGLARVLQDYGS